MVRVVPVSVPEGAAQTVVVRNSDWASGQGGVHDFCDPICEPLIGDIETHFG